MDLHQKLSTKDIFLALLGAAIVAFVIARCDAPSEPPKPTAFTAWSMCQQFLVKRLKAPASAKYPSSYDRYVKQIDDNTFHVESHVDVQNAFGAMLRANFVCTVRYAGNDTWNLVYLNLHEP